MPTNSYCSGCSYSDRETTIFQGREYCEDCLPQIRRTCFECDTEFHRYASGALRRTVDGVARTFCARCTKPVTWSVGNRVRSETYDKMGSNRFFGIELEVAECPQHFLWANVLQWGCKTDGSVSGGKEFISAPMQGDAGYENANEFCDLLIANNCTTDSRCGYHVHIDLEETIALQRKTLALAYYYTRDLWASLVNPDRRDTSYARFNQNSKHRIGTTWDRTRIMTSDDAPMDNNSRYVWCNWNAYNRHNTVEIRSHEGVVEPNIVINWVKAHTRFVDFVVTKTLGQITRMFGSEDSEILMKELRFIWKDDDLFDFYSAKQESGLVAT